MLVDGLQRHKIAKKKNKQCLLITRSRATLPQLSICEPANLTLDEEKSKHAGLLSFIWF